MLRIFQVTNEVKDFLVIRFKLVSGNREVFFLSSEVRVKIVLILKIISQLSDYDKYGQFQEQIRSPYLFNSQAFGFGLVSPIGSKIDFKEEPYF